MKIQSIFTSLSLLDEDHLQQWLTSVFAKLVSTSADAGKHKVETWRKVEHQNKKKISQLVQKKLIHKQTSEIFNSKILNFELRRCFFFYHFCISSITVLSNFKLNVMLYYLKISGVLMEIPYFLNFTNGN